MECQHPLSSQYVDRVRGQTSCMLCGQVLSDQQFELDPAFARSERGAGGGGMRAAGFARPSRAATAHGSHGLHRPSIDAARRQLTAIARKLSIPPSLVDIATSVFKMAVTANAVVGARSAVLCACLYIVCRRHQNETPLTVIDFSDVTGDSPFSIVSYMKIICKSTSTPIPPVDPVFYVARLCQLLEIPSDVLEPIAVYAMKVMRAMRDDWITIGRRPLGVAAASVLIACQVHGTPVDLLVLADLVRLHQFTIVLRVEEFAATPTAGLNNIDDYDPREAGNHTAPAAFLKGRRIEGEYVLADELRLLSETFYDLLNEAKAELPATPERIEKWNRFITAKSQTTGVPVEQLPHDLRLLSHREQLEALGAIPHGVKREESKVTPAVTLEPAAAAAQARALIEGNEALRDLNALPDVPPAGGARQPDTQPVGMQGHKPSKPQAETNADFELLDIGGDEPDAEEEYVIYDNEARLRSFKASQVAYKDEWDRAGAKFAALVQQANQAAEESQQAGGESQQNKRTQPQKVKTTAKSAFESVQRSLKQRGGAHIDLARLNDLLPGFDDEVNDDMDFTGGGAAHKPTRSAARSEVSVGGADPDEWVIE